MPVNPVGLGLPDVARVGALGSIDPATLANLILNNTPTPTVGSSSSGLSVVSFTTTLSNAQIQTNNTVPTVMSPTPPAGRFLYPYLVFMTARLPAGGTYGGAVTWGMFYENDLATPIFNASLNLQLNAGATTRRTAAAQPAFGSVGAGGGAPAFQTPAAVGLPTYSAQRVVLRGSGNVAGGNAGDSITVSALYMVLSLVP